MGDWCSKNNRNKKDNFNQDDSIPNIDKNKSFNQILNNQMLDSFEQEKKLKKINTIVRQKNDKSTKKHGKKSFFNLLKNKNVKKEVKKENDNEDSKKNSNKHFNQLKIEINNCSDFGLVNAEKNKKEKFYFFDDHNSIKKIKKSKENDGNGVFELIYNDKNEEKSGLYKKKDFIEKYEFIYIIHNEKSFNLIFPKIKSKILSEEEILNELGRSWYKKKINNIFNITFEKDEFSLDRINNIDNNFIFKLKQKKENKDINGIIEFIKQTNINNKNEEESYKRIENKESEYKNTNLLYNIKNMHETHVNNNENDNKTKEQTNKFEDRKEKDNKEKNIKKKENNKNKDESNKNKKNKKHKKFLTKEQTNIKKEDKKNNNDNKKNNNVNSNNHKNISENIEHSQIKS